MIGKSQNTGDGGANVGGDNSGTLTIGISFEDHEEALRERIAEVRELLERAHEAELGTLRQQLSEYERRLANPEQSYAELTVRIRELEKLLADMSHGIGENRLRSAHEALEKGDFSEADSIFEDVETRAIEHAAEAAFGRGVIAEQQIRWADAATHYARAADLAPTYDRLLKAGKFLYHAGRSADALRYNQALLDLASQEHGAEHATTATALSELAVQHNTLGQFAEAEPLYREAIEISAKTIGKEHPDYAMRLNNLAGLLWETVRLDEAEPLYREALEIGAKTTGNEHPDQAIRLNNLAGLLLQTGRLDEAESLFREALEIDAKTIGKEHPDYAIDLNNLATLLKDMGRREEARLLYAEAVAIFRARLGDAHPNTRKGAGNHARFLAAGETEEDRRALAELKGVFGEDIDAPK